MAVTQTCEQGHVTLWVSWSRLRSHNECKRKGSLQRAGKVREINNARGFFPGTVTDRVVTDWLNNEPEKNPGMMPHMVNDWIDKAKTDLKEQEGRDVVWKSKVDRDEVRADCIQAVTRIELDLNEFVLPYDYQPDFRFKAPLMMPSPDGAMDLAVINGAMDILVRRPNGRFCVYDVKMTRDNDYWKKTVGQLDFYSLATQIMFGEPALFTALLQPMCDKRVFEWGTPTAQLGRLMQSVQNYAWDVWSNDFPLAPNRKPCYDCDVKHACSRFKPVNGRLAF